MKRLAVVGAGLALIVAIVVGFVETRGYHREPIDWSLLGTRDNGQTLVVGFLSSYGYCTRDVRAELVPNRNGEVDVAVDADVKDCPQQAETLLKPKLVRVGEGIKGRPVRGAARSLRLISWRPFYERTIPKQPDVRGLSVLDATAVAGAYGYRLALGDVHQTRSSRGVARQRVGDHVVTVWF